MQKCFFLGLSFFFCFQSWALECPDGAEPASTYKAHSDANYKIHNFCQIIHKGLPVKHGPEEAVDKNGNVLERKNYKYGIEMKPDVSLSGLPSISNNHDSFLNIQVATDAVKTVLSTLLPFFTGSGCPHYQDQWLKILITQTTQELSYKFTEQCPFEGKVSYTKNGQIDIDLGLKNLNPFTQVTLHLKCLPTQSLDALVDLDCSTQDGILFQSGNNKTFFKLNYALTINPKLKKLMHANRGGKIIFSKIFGKTENFETDFLIEP